MNDDFQLPTGLEHLQTENADLRIQLTSARELIDWQAERLRSARKATIDECALTGAICCDAHNQPKLGSAVSIAIKALAVTDEQGPK